MAEFKQDHLSLANQVPTDENIAVFKSALAGSRTGVENALRKGGKPNFFHRPEDNKNALHVAAENGYLEICEILVNHGAIIGTVSATTQATPLILAAQNGHGPVVRFLLNQSADVTSRNGYGNTALHSACRAGSLDCVEQLIAAGSSINATNHKGSTPLHFACYGEDREEHPTSIVRALLVAGARVDARDSRGCTPLLICCSTGRMDIIALLREAGADITVKNDQGQDGHDIATFFNRPEIARHFGQDTPAKRFS